MKPKAKTLKREDMKGFDGWYPQRPFYVYANNADRPARVLRIGQKRLRIEYTTRAGTWRPWRTAADVRLNYADLDSLTTYRTAFRKFRELANAEGNYVPTIIPRDFWDWVLVCQYNRFQRQRGDKRRAYTGGL